METPRPGSAAWWQARAARPRRASTLTAERIVGAAIALLDADGLDAFSMRRLADALGTAPGSLYRHFESRDAVLVAVHDELIGSALDLEPDGSAPADRVLALARAQWRLLRERPYLATIWTSTEQLGPNALRTRERALRLALEAGIPDALAPRAYLLLLHFTIAFAALAQSLGARGEETEAYFAALPEEAFPAVRRLAGGLAHTTVEEEFELGLRALVAGLVQA